MPAKKAMVAGGSGEGIGIAGQDFVANGAQALAEDFAHVRVLAGPPNDGGHAVLVNVANGELIQVGGEAAARLDLAARVDDQGLAGTFAVIFLEPLAVPGA